MIRFIICYKDWLFCQIISNIDDDIKRLIRQKLYKIQNIIKFTAPTIYELKNNSYYDIDKNLIFNKSGIIFESKDSILPNQLLKYAGYALSYENEKISYIKYIYSCDGCLFKLHINYEKSKLASNMITIKYKTGINDPQFKISYY